MDLSGSWMRAGAVVRWHRSFRVGIHPMVKKEASDDAWRDVLRVGALCSAVRFHACRAGGALTPFP